MIETTLMQRGHRVHRMNPWELILAPREEAYPEQREAFYQAC